MKTMDLFALIVAASVSTPAFAEDCKLIQDTVARLACFDKGTSRSPKPKKVTVDEFAEAKTAMAKKLTDPESARFEDLFKARTSYGEVICGKVNSKNRMGGYVGATGFIFETSIKRATLMFSGGSDPEYSGASAASYCLYCASDPRGDQNISDHCPSLIKSYPGR